MYKIINENMIQRLADGANIPRVEDNTDYRVFLEWEAAGGVIEPPSADPAYVPGSVSRYQARAALLEAGLLDDVEAYFESLPDSSLAKLAWKEAPTVNRTSDALTTAAGILGLTDERLDALFLRAEQFV
ncbi:hypothetical protein D3C71_1212270 [compost metagenome]